MVKVENVTLIQRLKDTHDSLISQEMQKEEEVSLLLKKNWILFLFFFIVDFMNDSPDLPLELETYTRKILMENIGVWKKSIESWHSTYKWYVL